MSSQQDERVISDVCATIENRCGIVRGIGPAVREAVGPVLADRDRYRQALERIAAGRVPGVTFADDDLISAFAAEALDA